MKKLILVVIMLFVFSCQKDTQKPEPQKAKKEFYRIKQVDKNGSAHYSKIIVVQK
jgi:hypothetical protein